MEITRTGVAALVALCGAAGASGAYLATRTDLEPATATVSAAPATTSAAPATTSPTESLVPVEGATASAAVGTVARTPSAVASAPRSKRVAAPANDRAAGTARPQPATISQRPASTVDNTAAAASPQEPFVRVPEARVVKATEPDFEELVIASDAVLGLQMDTTVSSEEARVEDMVVAHVTRDVRVADRIAIPAGTKAYGEVTIIERGGRLRERARLGIRFSSLLMADGSRVPLSTEEVFRDGDSPSRESAAKIGGGAIGGAIIGGILGGGKGAILGGTAGAGAGTAVAMAGGRNAATLAAGTPVTVRLTRPATVTVDR